MSTLAGGRDKYHDTAPYLTARPLVLHKNIVKVQHENISTVKHENIAILMLKNIAKL